MAIEVIMPQLGESVVEGTVTKWLVNEGDQIEEFDALLEVNTDKVDTEVPAPAGGVLLKIYVPEGQTVKAGTLLAAIGEQGEIPPEAPQELTEAAQEQPETQPAASAETQPQQAVSPGRSADLGFISPVVARIAAEHDVNLQLVEGSGRGGRITKKDVLMFIESGHAEPEVAAAPWESPASGELFRPTEEIFKPTGKVETSGKPGEVIPHTTVRRSIAEHMVRSKETSPHVTTVMEADLRQVVKHREANKALFEREGVKLTYTAYFAAATVWALKEVPIVNSSWGEDGVHLHPQVNLGIAVSLGEDGLIVPVIKAAEQLSLLALARSIYDLANRARDRQLEPDEVQGGTFTITNHGVAGSLFATPIISQPQSAILGVGAIQKRVVAVEMQSPSGDVEDVFAIRPMLYLSLTFDHRILDGAVADHFLGQIVKSLEAWS
jgi:pyruvate/2-oxoglutarate dehydrogenase complex dihydrolipoamide acyltransferase (E2) component